MSFETGLADSEVEALYSEYKHIIKQKVRLAKTTFARHVDECVLEEQALQAFIRTCRNWDPTKGATFSTCLHRWVERELKDVSHRKAEYLARGYDQLDNVFSFQLTDEMSEVLHQEAQLPSSLLGRVTADKLSTKAKELFLDILAEGNMHKACRKAKVSLRELPLLIEEICGAVFGCTKDALEKRAEAGHLLEVAQVA